MKTTYENNGGAHATEDGTTVNRGSQFTSPDPDLCKKFPGKFRVVPPGAETAALAVPTPKEQPVVPAVPETATGGDEGATAVPDGKDVTSEFTKAADNNLLVTKTPKGWNVYEQGDPDPINDTPLLKKDVQAFIDDYLTEE